MHFLCWVLLCMVFSWSNVMAPAQANLSGKILFLNGLNCQWWWTKTLGVNSICHSFLLPWTDLTKPFSLQFTLLNSKLRCLLLPSVNWLHRIFAGWNSFKELNKHFSPFSLSRCQWQDDNPWSLNYESRVIPLCRRGITNKNKRFT